MGTTHITSPILPMFFIKWRWENFVDKTTEQSKLNIKNIWSIKTIYKYDNITSNNDIVDILDDIKDNDHISKSNYRLFRLTITELIDNMVRYTPKELQHKSHIEIWNDQEWWYIYLKAVNYFKQKNSKELNKKIDNMSKLSNLTKDNIRSEKKELDKKEEKLNKNWGAWKWFTEMINSLSKNLSKKWISAKEIQSLIATTIPHITQIDEITYKFESNIKMPILQKKNKPIQNRQKSVKDIN